MHRCKTPLIQAVNPRRPLRAGFTLIELLVAITILGIISALTFTMLNVTMDSDRISSASREVQSFLEGARNQAIYAKAPRGVRFLLNPEDPTTVNSMIYIGPPSTFTGVFETFLASPALGNVGAADTQNELDNLARRGLLTNGARIRIPRTGTDALWYTIAHNGTDWALTKNYQPTMTLGPQQFELELSPAVLPNQEPRLLARNVFIDLDNSLLPASWGSNAPYSPVMDILFSPKGAVMGAVGAAGRIHFTLSDVTDTNNNITARTATGMTATSTSALYPQWAASHDFSVGDWVVPDPAAYIAYRVINDGGTSSGGGPPAWPTEIGATVVDQDLTWQCFSKRPNLIVSLATQTGNTAGYPADVIQRTPGLPPDPFYYAVTGEVAK